jgi:O-antigen/teichoic acid export membrane protein
MGLAGLIGEGGLGTLMTGEIIRHPGRERGLIAAAALVSLVLAFAAGGLSLLGSDLAVTSGGLHPDLPTSLLFLVGCCLTGFSSIIDHAFVGMLSSIVGFYRQLVFSGFKLVLIAIVAAWSSSEAAILLTWIASQAISLIFVEWVMRRRGAALFHRPDFRLVHRLRKTAAAYYVLNVASQAPVIAMPYLVAVLLSPTANAAFSIIWMMCVCGTVIPGALTSVLFPAIRAAPEQYRDKMLLSLGLSMAFAIAFGVFVFAFSERILTLVNPVYAQIAGSSLQWVGFGLVGGVFKVHFAAAARLNDATQRASALFGVGAVLELAGAAVGGLNAGLEGVAVGWIAATVIEAGVVLLIGFRDRQWTLPAPAVPNQADG